MKENQTLVLGESSNLDIASEYLRQATTHPFKIVGLKKNGNGAQEFTEFFNLLFGTNLKIPCGECSGTARTMLRKVREWHDLEKRSEEEKSKTLEAVKSKAAKPKRTRRAKTTRKTTTRKSSRKK